MTKHTPGLVGRTLLTLGCLAFAAQGQTRALPLDLDIVLASRTSRAPGTPGNLALEEAVADHFAGSGLENGRLWFDCPVFEPGRTTIRLSDGKERPLLPMHPTLLRPGNFDDTHFTASLVYLGQGTEEDLTRQAGTDLHNAVAVMEFDGADRWMGLMRFGVRGFIFLAAEEYAQADAYDKVYNTEVRVPRFFAPASVAAALRDACATRPAVTADIDAEPSTWRTARLSVPWVLIPGSDPELSRDAIVLTAPIDADAVVPELAAGRNTLGNLALLLELLDTWRTTPPSRSILLAAVNVHTQAYLGERILAWHLLSPQDEITRLRDMLARQARVDELVAEHYRRLSLAPTPLPAEELDTAVTLLWTLQREAPDAPLAETVPAGRLRQGLDQALLALNEERKGFRARMITDEGVARSLVAKEATLQAARQWDDAHLADVVRKARPVFDDERLLESWRAGLDTSTGVRVAIKNQLQARVKRELNIAKMSNMELSRAAARNPEAKAELEPRLAELRTQRVYLTHVLALFNKIDIGVGNARTRYRQIAASGPERELLKTYRDDLYVKLTESAARQRELLDIDVRNGAVRAVLGMRAVRLVISLGADWSAEQVGFCSLNADGQAGWLRELGAIAADVAGAAATTGTAASVYVDSLSGAGGLPQEHFFAAWQSPSIVFHAAQGMPAVTLKSAFHARSHAFLPQEHDPAASFPRPPAQAADFLRALVEHPDLTKASVCTPLNTSSQPRLWSCLVRTFEMDEFAPQPTPSLPVPGTLIAAYTPAKGTRVLPPFVDGDVVNTFTAQADETGQALLYGVWEPRLAPTAYRLDTNAVHTLAVIDKGRIQQSKQMSSNMSRSFSKTLPMFACREFIVYDRMDPSAVGSRPIAIDALWPISAESGADPGKFGVHGVVSQSAAWSHNPRGPAAVYLQRKQGGFIEDALVLLTGTREFVVNPTEEIPEGIGYRSTEALGPDFFIRAAHDMEAVCSYRLSRMHGVVNELVTEFLQAAREALAAADAAAAQNDHGDYRRAAATALGNAVKAYRQIRNMNADMLKAIIVYMALMVPFCYFLQKLLFNLNRLEHEIFAFLGLFVVTYTGFRLIHPAFAIALSAEAIFVAFILGAIGCLVTWILHSRFSAEMDVLFRGVVGFGDDAAGAGFVGQTAMLIGVNNMKRRRTRTVLTTATVVLVVFTILAFSSVSRSVRPTLVNRGDVVPYSGLFYTWPGGAPMDEDTVRVLESLYGHHADILVRRVWQPETVQADGHVRWRVARADDPDRSAFVMAALSLSPDEPRFVGQTPLLRGRLFSSNHAEEVIVPATLADALGIDPDGEQDVTLRFMGFDLVVVGIMEDERYRMLRDLDPDFLLFPKPAAEGDTTRSAGQANAGFGDMVDLSGVLFLPPALLREVGAHPYAVSVRFDDSVLAKETGLWDEAERLLRVADPRFVLGSTQPFKVQAGAKRATAEGAYLVGGSYRTAIGGLSRLVVPLLIAGLILFNTMLGTVYERKPEIAIYNAIGLNPHHIFIFFLAEALVYGVIGSIGGYLIGQILTVIAQALNLVRGLSVNFSSLMVVWAILFTIGLVVLSTVYPALVATRTAVPSGTRRWSLPDHDGDDMDVLLPFIYLPDMAPGVMAYLDAFFGECCEESLGDMIATPRGCARTPDAEGRPAYTTRYEVALAPYDLGVTQSIELLARYSAAVESYELHLHIQRESGQDASWVATNRPLLERLRHLLLRWRNLDPAHHRDFVLKAKELF